MERPSVNRSPLPSKKPLNPLSAKGSHRHALTKHVRAQSDSLGVIFLVVVVVILVALLGLFVFGVFDDEGGEEHIITSVKSELTPEEFTIRHGGGDTLDPENVEVYVEQNGERVVLTPLSGVSDPPEDSDRFSGGGRWTHDISLVTGQVRLVVVHTPTNTRLHERREEFTLTADGVTLSVNGSTNSTTVVGADDPLDIADVQVSYTVEATFDGGASGPVTTRATLDTPALLDMEEPGLLTAGGPGESSTTVTVTATYRNKTSNAVKVTVQPGRANYSVAIEEISTEGTTARIDYNVTNIGNLTGKQDIELLVGNQTANATTVREDLVVGPRETVEGEFQYDIAGSTTPVNFTVRSRDDFAPQILPVSQRLFYGISSPSSQSINSRRSTNWSSKNSHATATYVSALELSPDGDLLGVGGTIASKLIQLRNTTNWTLEGQPNLWGQTATHIEWSPDGQYFAATVHKFISPPISPSYNQERFLVFDVTSNEEIENVSMGEFQTVNALEWSPDGSVIAVGRVGGAIEVYDTDSWDRTEVYETRTQIRSLSWSTDGSRLAAGTGTGTLPILQADSWEVTRNVSVPNPVKSVAWSPDGELLAHGNGGSMVLRETEDWTVTETLPEVNQSVSTLEWSEWASYIAVHDGQTMSVYRRSDWSLETSFPAPTQLTGPVFQPVAVEESG